jgi:superfamily II DNA/RNA helicase
MKFDAFGLDEQLLEAIGYMGFENATPIQEQAIPEIIKGRDLLATAQTGTGKTASFVLPILDEITKEGYPGICALIIVPTRELALQIDQQIQAFSYFTPATSMAIYGGGDGDDWDQQKKALTEGTEIIIATPGKLLSHLNMGLAKFKNIKHLILDEADRMLDMGFYDDITKIISYLPEKRQNLMFSATMPYKIREFANAILKDPVVINIKMSKPAEGVLQAAYLCHDDQKYQLLRGLIKDKPDFESILIFSSTRRKVSQIMKALKGNNYKVEGISSDLEQSEREAVLLRFKSRKTRVLVATDVLSRGIDIKGINLIINFDVPGNAEDYVHRIGRTARADTTGVAITFINADDMYKFAQIERLIEREVPKIPLPPELGEGPEWKPSSRGGGYRKGGNKPKGKYRGKNQKRKR